MLSLEDIYTITNVQPRLKSDIVPALTEADFHSASSCQTCLYYSSLGSITTNTFGLHWYSHEYMHTDTL